MDLTYCSPIWVVGVCTVRNSRIKTNKYYHSNQINNFSSSEREIYILTRLISQTLHVPESKKMYSYLEKSVTMLSFRCFARYLDIAYRREMQMYPIYRVISRKWNLYTAD